MLTSKHNVLLVDDEPQVLVALEDLLSDEFTVLKTQSAESALGVARSHPDIAVVVSDQRMPRMTGDELFARLCHASDAMRILVTGYADMSAVIRAVNEGRIFGYVTKPWNPDEFRLIVRKAAEHFALAKELTHERQLLSDLMDNIPDGIYFKDRELRFLRANHAYAGVVGCDGPEALAGKRIEEVLPDREAARADEAEERRVLADAVATQDVVREYRRDGVTRWFSETKAPIRQPGGEVIGLVGIARDVTERTHTQEQMLKLEQQLLQSQKMDAIGKLAGGVAHDFNNLLSVITGYGELVMQDLPEGDGHRADLAELLGAAQRAASLTRQLLAFSRRQVVKPEVLDLNEVVRNVERMLRRVIGEQIELRVELEPGLGAIRADASQIEQIILNLTVNARDAMPGGGVIHIRTENVQLDAPGSARVPTASGEFVRLSVTDTGIGMDAETQSRIFEPFFTTKEVGKGTGLGLSTVYGIVQHAGGHVVVESEVGRGAEFAVHFPRVSRAKPESAARRTSTVPVAGAGTVLLVEDEDAVRQVTARILRDRGYSVLEARRGSEARVLCESHRGGIDLLLVDVVMPEISGPKLAEELVLHHPGLRVLFMSGYSGGEMQGAAVELESSYIEKPFTPGLLAEKVREVLLRD